VAEFKEKVELAGVLNGQIEPLLKGADIADVIQPGPRMGALLKHAYELQIENNITDKVILKAHIVKKINK
jgi:hypothetical protein